MASIYEMAYDPFLGNPDVCLVTRPLSLGYVDLFIYPCFCAWTYFLLESCRLFPLIISMAVLKKFSGS